MLIDTLPTIIIPIALRLLLALAIWIAGRWLARRSQDLLAVSLPKTALTPSLISLIKTLSYYGLLILAAIIALGVLGVPVAMLASMLGIVAIVLAIALQQSLSSLAATVVILLFKPFQVGDVIETGGMLGTVQEIQLLNTVLSAPDGKTHVVPNAKIQSGGLTNHSTTGRLRLDLRFPISHASDLDRAKKVLADLLAADERVLAEPPARVFVRHLDDNSVELAAWPFARPQDTLALQGDLIEQIKTAFEEQGITIPHPGQDVHLFSHDAAAQVAEEGGVQ